jgi:hypothetical protein
MVEGFAVTPNEVDAHAATVEGFAGRVDTAVDAGAHVASLDDAYGLFCRPFPILLKDPQQRGVDTLRETTRQMHDTVTNLRESAEHYRDVETRVVERIEKLLDKLDRTAKAPMARGDN